MVKWGRSSEGFVESKCGRFSISPEYWGRCTPQSYELKDKETGRCYRSLDTQADAKARAHGVMRVDVKAQEATHGPEPWRPGWVSNSGRYYETNTHTCDANGESTGGVANTLRKVACVNACAGINPEAVPELLASILEVRESARNCTPEVWGRVDVAISKVTEHKTKRDQGAQV